MKRQSKAQKFNDLANAVNQINAGDKVKRIGRKDGSIGTKPVVPCPDLPESDVLQMCLYWLRKSNMFCSRNNVGAGAMGASGFYSYGIKNGGDIIGLLPTGQHFEIECKAGYGGTLSKGQRKRMKDIRDNNGLYFIIHGLPELEYYFERYV